MVAGPEHAGIGVRLTLFERTGGESRQRTYLSHRRGGRVAARMDDICNGPARARASSSIRTLRTRRMGQVRRAVT
jgi:hypothetical protein